MASGTPLLGLPFSALDHFRLCQNLMSYMNMDVHFSIVLFLSEIVSISPWPFQRLSSGHSSSYPFNAWLAG